MKLQFGHVCEIGSHKHVNDIRGFCVCLFHRGQVVCRTLKTITKVFAASVGMAVGTGHSLNMNRRPEDVTDSFGSKDTILKTLS